MTFRDPPRLSQSADPQFRSVMRAAKSDLPDPTRLDRILTNIRTETGPGGGGGGSPSSGGAALPKLAAATIAAGAVVGAIFLASPHKTSSSVPASVPVPASASVPASVPVPVPVPVPATSTSTPTPISALPDSPPRELAEIALLQSAQRALSSDPRGALDFIARHARAYPKGDFAEERDVLRIDALARLGRKDEALSRAADHQRRYPHSAHRPRVEAILAKE